MTSSKSGRGGQTPPDFQAVCPACSFKLLPEIDVCPRCGVEMVDAAVSASAPAAALPGWLDEDDGPAFPDWLNGPDSEPPAFHAVPVAAATEPASPPIADLPDWLSADDTVEPEPALVAPLPEWLAADDDDEPEPVGPFPGWLLADADESEPPVAVAEDAAPPVAVAAVPPGIEEWPAALGDDALGDESAPEGAWAVPELSEPVAADIEPATADLFAASFPAIVAPPVLSAPSPAVQPKPEAVPIVPAPAAAGRAIRQTLAVASLAALVVAAPFVRVPIPVEPPNANVVRAFGAIDRLPVGSTALVAFDYSVDRAAEVESAAKLVVDELARQQVRLVTVTTRPNGANLARPLTSQANVTELGFIAGDAEGIKRLGRREGADHASPPTDPALRKATAGKAVDMLVVFANDEASAVRWTTEFRRAAWPPAIVVIPNGDAWGLTPLLNNGQLAGALAGNRDAAGFAMLTGRGDVAPVKITPGPQPGIAIAMFALLGAVASLTRRAGVAARKLAASALPFRHRLALSQQAPGRTSS